MHSMGIISYISLIIFHCHTYKLYHTFFISLIFHVINTDVYIACRAFVFDDIYRIAHIHYFTFGMIGTVAISILVHLIQGKDDLHLDVIDWVGVVTITRQYQDASSAGHLKNKEPIKRTSAETRLPMSN